MKWQAVVLFLVIAILGPSCASFSDMDTPPELSMQKLEISKDIPGFEYRWKECVKHFLGMCTKTEVRVAYYDLTDPRTKAKLKDMGFVLQVREKPIPQ